MKTIFSKGGRGWILGLACVSALLIVTSTAVFSVTDTDGDGLSDADEVNIFHTDPNKFDTDGDGMGDGDEVRSGTDPLNPLSVFKLLGPLERISGGWRVKWQSVPGRIYKIQRAANDQLNTTNWTEIGQVTAAGLTSSFDDALATNGQRFYRVTLETVAVASYYQGNPDRFLPLNAQNQPIESGLIPLNPDGSLTPFEFRPAGRSLAGSAQGFFIRFPNGAKVVDVGGVQYFQFTLATAGFGTNSPFQLASPLSLNGPIANIPLHSVDVASIAAAFGIQATNGLSVKLFGIFPLNLIKGVFDDTGLRGAQVAIPNLGLPLPGSSGNYSDIVLDISAKGGIKIPFAGGFNLADGSAFAPHVIVATNRPIWVEFKPTGGIGLGGRADVTFSNGPNFSVDFGLDDPYYHLQMSAGKIHVPLLDSLADLLPTAPTVPSTSDAAQLEAARARLVSFDKAMLNFSAAAVGAAPASADGNPNVPAAAFATATSVLDAWGFAAASSAGGLPPSSLLNALRHSGQSASGAHDLKSAVCQRLSLLRLKQAFTGGGLSNDPGVQTELDNALTEARAAIVSRANTPDAVQSIENMIAVLQCLLELDALRQQLGLPADAELQTALRSVMQRFVTGLINAQQIQAGVYSAADGSPIASMNRFTALDYLRQVAEVFRVAQLLGIDDQIAGPVGELKGQLGLRASTVINGNLLAAEVAGDYTGFTYAVEDALEIAALNQTGFFPQVGALSSLPGAAFLTGLPSRLNAVFNADFAKPIGERSLNNQRQDLRRLTKIIRQLPSGFTYNPAPIQRAYDRLETTLNQSMIVINTFSLSDLNALLDAGIVQAEIRDRFGLAAPVSWETARLPMVVTRIGTLATQTNGWSELHDAIGILLTEAARQDTNGNQVQRRLYLAKAAELAVVSRTVATALWQNEKTRRNANPLLQVADMLLPGDIFVDRIAGSVRYDRQRQFVDGAFSGELSLPKFGLKLTVDNASINTGGAFDLNAYGQINMPLQNPVGTISIPARHPLEISFRPPRSLTLSAGAALTLQNGMSFETHVKLADPLYAFGFSAAGLRFYLATNVFGYIPVPNTAGIHVLGSDLSVLLNNYFKSLSATAEPMSGLLDAPKFGDIGTPPDFGDSIITVSTDPLNATANGLLLVLGAPFVLGYVAADATAQQISDATTSIVTNILNTLEPEIHRQAGVVSRLRDDFLNTPPPEKSVAARNLCDELKDHTLAFQKITDLGLDVNRKQQLGRLAGGTAANPLRKPATAEYHNHLRDTLTTAFVAPESVQDLDTAICVLTNALNFRSTLELQGLGIDAGFDPGLATFVAQARTNIYASYGLGPNGGITDAAKFNSLDAEHLEKAGVDIATIEQIEERLGLSTGATYYQNALETVLLRQRQRLVDDYVKAAAAKYPYRNSPDVDGLRQEQLEEIGGKLIGVYQRIQANGISYNEPLPNLDGTTNTLTETTDFIQFLTAMSDAKGKRADYWGPTSRHDETYVAAVRDRKVKVGLEISRKREELKLLQLAASQPGVSPGLRQSLKSNIDQTSKQLLSLLEQLANSPPYDFSLNQAAEVGSGLRNLAGVIEQTGKSSGSSPSPQGLNLNEVELQKFKVTIFPAYTARITVLADAQKAWWIAGRSSEIFLDGLAGKAMNDFSTIETAVFQSAQATLDLAGHILTGLRQSVLATNRPIDLRLPGDVEIERIFGDLFFNRETGLIRGTFGGRVQFPDLKNAFFEISNATLDNNLNFSIDAATSGPLPFNGVIVGGTVHASGGLAPAPLVFQGTGTLSLTNGPTVNVALSWNSTNHVLSFDTQASQLQSLRFTDNLVLFDAGFGFTVRPDSQSGELRANGSAGFFPKGTLPPAPKQTNFHLFADNVRAVVAYQPGQVGLAFSNGTLHLPTLFYPTNMATLCPGTGPATGPSISLNPQAPIQATFVDGSTPSVSFSGELDFRQFGLAVPEIPGLAAAICTAQLKFSSSALPYLTNVSASLQIPLPFSTNIVDFTNGVFTLTGYPSGRVGLRNDLTMLDVNGFKFTLLGQGHPGCPGGSGLTVFPSSGFNQVPSFKLDGGLRVDAPLSMLTGTNGDQVFGLACGSLSITNGQRPDLIVNTLEFGGTFHLGSGGPVIKNALISLQDLPNLFRLDNQHQFLVRLEGALQIPNGPEFTLQDAHFSFFDYQRLPKFSVASVGVNNENFTMLNYLPAKVKQATLAFKAPSAELPYLFYPTNIDLGFSAEIRFPATGNPMFVGAVDKVEIDFDTNNFPRVKQIDGFELGVGGMKIPPIKELGGRIKLGGLSANDPSKIYMVGRLGGSYQGYQVIGQAAFNLFGPLGFCLDVNAGSVGIPLGPTGILITGASGGESFVNNNGDPCDFKTYFSVDAQGNLIAPSSPTPPGLGMSWEAFRNVVERMEADAATFTQNVPGLLNPGQSGLSSGGRRLPTLSALDNSTTVNLPCPGDCPPATVNIFCQPHPDQAMYPGKVIAKFSSINESTLNGIGITPSFIQGLGPDFSSMAGAVSHAIRMQIQSLTPPPDPGLLPPSAVASLGTVITNTLNALESSFSNFCHATLANPQAADTSYNIIKRLVYEGLPCPDVTMAVSGNVSYAGVSSVAYIGGKGLLSTTGAGGVVGTIYVLGIPFGEARVFVAATDAQGNPNPSICGQASVGFGPLEIGEVKLSYACPGCVNGVMAGFFDMIGALSDSVLNRITAKVAPEIAAQNLGRFQLLLALGNLSTQKKLGFFAELANEPLSSLPPDLPQVFFQGIANTYDSINPIVIACGNVGPKLFGLPLGSDIVGVKMFATKEEFAGSFDFSLSALLGAYGPFLPLGETATMSFSMAVRDAYKFVFGGLAGGFAPNSSVAYVQSAIDYMLQNTSYGMAFDFSPFGFKTFDAAARVVIPNLTTHPVLPWSNWVRPEDRGVTNLPSRHDLVLAAIATDRLGDAVNWRGTTNDLYTVYPEGSPQRAALSGLSLQKDYFPHGGVIGGALLTLPAALTEKPPVDKFQIVANPNAAPLDRVLTAIDLIQNYFLRFNTNGELAFYIPAPNPPVLYDNNGLLLGQSQLENIATNLTPQGVLDAIKSFNIANLRVGNFYPIEQAFIRGYLDGQLLGVPIVRSDVLGLPANQERTEGFLSVTSNIPNGSWLKQFIPQASLIFDMRGLPPEPIEKKFTRIAAQLQAAVDTNANAAALSDLAGQALASLTADLPKVQLTADLQVGLNMPAPIADISHFNGTAQLHAFSPRYEPTYQTNNYGPLARVRREGGIAFQGSLSLRLNGMDIANIPNAELSAVPKDSGLPTLSGQYIAPVISLPGLSLNNWLVDFASDPTPHFTAAGSVSGLGVSLFNIQPLSGTSLTGRVDVAGTPPAMTANLAVSPAQLILPSIYAERILIHGATRNDPFTFSTTGPWNATLELTNNLTLGVGGVSFVSLGAGGLFTPITFAGNGTSSGSFTIGFGPGAGITLFPGDATLQRALSISAGITGSLTVNSDATFLLTTTLGGSALNFNGIDVPAGANLSVSNNGVSITWFINNGATTATLSIGANKQVVFSGSAELSALNFGIFQITSANGGNLSGAFNNDGFAVNSGAKLTLLADWLNNQSVTLSSFTFSNNGAINVSVNAAGTNLSFAGFPFDLSNFTFQRAATNLGGAASLGLAGSLHATPNFPGFPSQSFTGNVSTAGTVFLQASAASASFFGFPVQRLTNTFQLNAGQFVGTLSNQFQLGNNSGLWAALGSNWFSGALSLDGSMSLLADGPTNTVAGFGLDNVLFRFNRLAGQNPSVLLEGGFAPPGFSKFRLAGGIGPNGGIFLVPAVPAPSAPIPYPTLNGQVSLLLTNSGVQVSGVLNQAPLPSLSLTGAVYLSGAFSLTGSVASATVAGYGLNNLTVVLDRVAGGVPNVQASAKLALVDFSSVLIGGGFTNNNTFGLFASLPTYNTGLPVSTLTGGTLGWTHNGVSLAGTLTGGVLTKVLPTATVSGAIAFSPLGAKTLSGLASIAPFTNGHFRLRPISGVNFSASMNNNGLTLPGGALFEFSNFLTSSLAVPEVTLAADGSFSTIVGVPAPVSFTLRNFGLDNVTFSLLRDAAGNLSVPSFNASLTVPQLNVPVTVNGSWTNNGTFRLAGGIGGAVNLSGLGLPVTGLNGGASVEFNQTSLTVTGNLNGSLFSTLPGVSAGGTLTVTPSAVSLGGAVTIPPLTLGAFSIQNSGGGNITAQWRSGGVEFPAGLRLFYNGAAAGTFSLPSFTNAANGDFSLSIPSTSPVTFSNAGWRLSNAFFTLRRLNGVVSIPTFSGTVSPPGFTAAPAITLSGSLLSDTTFSLTSTLGGSLSTLGSSFGSLGWTSLTLDNDSLRLAGTFSGGVLDNVSAGLTASGAVEVGLLGQLTPSASVTFPEIIFGTKTTGFHIAPVAGGNFQATLDASGISVPAGAQIFFRNVSLGGFSLPQFNIPTGGDFGVGSGSVGFAIDGYSLIGNLTLTRSGSVTRLLVSGGASLPLPGLGQTVSVSGSLTNNDSLLITGTSGSSVGFGGLPIAGVATGATAELARIPGGPTTLKIKGTITGGVLSGSTASDIRLVSAGGEVQLSAGGLPSLTGTVQVQPFTAGIFTIEGNGNGVPITASWNGSTLRMSDARLRSMLGGFFSTAIPVPNIDVPFNGAFTQSFGPASFGIKSFPFTGINFQLKRSAPNGAGFRDVTIPNFAGNLGFTQLGSPRFPGGNIPSDGNLQLDYAGSLTIDGFAAANGFLRLRSGGMTAGGSFNLFAAGRAFNSTFGFSGSVFPDGTYSLTGSGSLDIANIEMPTASFTFSNGSITGSPTLKFGDGSGKLDFATGNFSLTQSGGVSFSKSIGFNQSVSIAGSPSFASINLNANLSSSGGNSGQVQVTGSASAFGFNLPTVNVGVGSDLEFALNFGPNCVQLDLSPVRAKFCGANWP